MTGSEADFSLEYLNLLWQWTYMWTYDVYISCQIKLMEVLCDEAGKERGPDESEQRIEMLEEEVQIKSDQLTSS